MGPIVIFDKSFLQCISVDESVWLGTFFITNITPPFFMETLADLEANPQNKNRNRREPEQVVANLANKTPSLGSKVNVHHTALIYSELFENQTIELRYGFPIIAHGKKVQLEGKQGTIVVQSEEEEALNRWQEKRFADLEKQTAKRWRSELAALNLGEIYAYVKPAIDVLGRPKSFDEAKTWVDLVVDSPDRKQVTFCLDLVGIPREEQKNILGRWEASGSPTFRKFAPYSAHVASVEFFFCLAIGSDLISRDRPSHRIDFSYLYYLPFCHFFTSNDKLHKTIAPLFLGKHQQFVEATHFKAELARLDEHFSKLPDEIKARGVTGFALYPPDELPGLVTDLWDKYCPLWRRQKRDLANKPPRSPESDVRLAQELGRFEKEAFPIDEHHQCDERFDDYVVFRHLVPSHLGKWQILPDEIISASPKD